MISEEKKKQLEDKQLNKKLKILSQKSSFYNPHKLNSISMPEPELKKHLRNGDYYNT